MEVRVLGDRVGKIRRNTGNKFNLGRQNSFGRTHVGQSSLLKGAYLGDYVLYYYEVIKGDSRSLHYGSYAHVLPLMESAQFPILPTQGPGHNLPIGLSIHR